jgi:ComEC/Rec2-related protein
MRGWKKITEIWRAAPLGVPAVFYLSGILLGKPLQQYFAFFQQPQHYGLFFLVLAGLILGLFTGLYGLPNYAILRHNKLLYGMALGLLLPVGAWSYGLEQQGPPLQHDMSATLYAKVIQATPTQSQKNIRLYCELIAFRQGAQSQRSKARVFLYIPVADYDSRLQRGSRLLTICHIAAQNPDMAYMPPLAFLRARTPLVFSSPKPGPFARLRQAMLHKIRTHIKNTQSYALLAGISLGETEAFDPELLAAYATAGATHVLSVSGLHVGIVYALFLLLLSPFLKNSRRDEALRQLIIVAALVGYAAMANFVPPVLRAVLMAGLFALAKWLGRPISALQTLAISAILLCSFYPAGLFDVGFQLSFLAVLSILCIEPRLTALITVKNKVGRYIWSMLTVSTAAQMGTAALVYYYFKTFAPLFLLTSLWVIPLTGVLIYLLLAWIVLSPLPWLGPALLWLLENLAYVTNQGVIFIDKIS